MIAEIKLGTTPIWTKPTPRPPRRKKSGIGDQSVRTAHDPGKGDRVLEKVEEDITDIIIRELGGTRLKAFFEIGLVKNIIKEASTYPLRMTGEILPSVMDGKENRLYRVPVGVVGVISPFNFPFFLSMRSVATALGAGNGVVLKPHDDTANTGGTLVAKDFRRSGNSQGTAQRDHGGHQGHRRRVRRASASRA